MVTFDNEIYSTSLRELSTRQLMHDDNTTSCLDLTGQTGRFRTRVYTQKPTGEFNVTVIKTMQLPCSAIAVMETQSEMDGQGPARFLCNLLGADDTACVFVCRNKFVDPVDITITLCQNFVVDVFMSKTTSGAMLCSIDTSG